MNRREFVKDSLLSGVTGLAGGNLLAAATSGSSSAAVPAQGSVSNHRIYAHLLDPREHPDYARHHVKPPSWDTFDHQTQRVTFRRFTLEHGRIVHYAEDLEKYTRTYDLGNVIWPFCSMLFAANLGDVLDEIKRRNLFVFDVMGLWARHQACFGSLLGRVSAAAGRAGNVRSKVGRSLAGHGYRRAGRPLCWRYASQMYPTGGSHFQQYLNFHRYAEGLRTSLGARCQPSSRLALATIT